MLKIVFFGTPQFAATVLDFLLKQPLDVLAVVTKPDKPKGRSGVPRPPPVKVLAEKHRLPIYQPIKASAPEFADFLKTLEADLFVVVAYSEILRDNLLQIPKRGCINVHASLLPKYRGAAPIQRCIIAGEKESGVTIMSMAKELDAGDILGVAKVPISDEMTSGELFEALSHIGAKALWDVLQEIEKGSAKRLPQHPESATYAKKLVPEEGELDWKKSATELHNLVRGVTPKPGAWCWVSIRGEQKRLLIKKTHVQKPLQGVPGTLLPSPELTIACSQDALQLVEVQLEGKKTVTAEEFLRGYAKSDLKFITKF